MAGFFFGCLMGSKCLNYGKPESARPQKLASLGTTGYCSNCEMLMAYEFEMQRARRRTRQGLEKAIVKFLTKLLRNCKVW